MSSQFETAPIVQPYPAQTESYSDNPYRIKHPFVIHGEEKGEKNTGEKVMVFEKTESPERLQNLYMCGKPANRE
jgi:hypothetical protein